MNLQKVDTLQVGLNQVGLMRTSLVYIHFHFCVLLGLNLIVKQHDCKWQFLIALFL